MAKTTQAEALALEALARLLGDPSPKVLHGSKAAPGMFAGGSAAEKAAAKLCIDHGWLGATGEGVGKGKTRKELYRITPAGLQAVLSRSDPTELLRGLADNLKQIEERSTGLPRAVQEASTALIHQLEAFRADLQKTITDAFRPFETVQTSLQAMKMILAQALERFKPVDIGELTRKLAAGTPGAATASPNHSAWAEEVVHMVAEQKQRNAFQRLTLPQILERLRARHPDLTLGQFHDGLRRLQDEKRIRLGPYTQALATLDDPRNALFLDREVKYYVELP